MSFSIVDRWMEFCASQVDGEGSVLKYVTDADNLRCAKLRRLATIVLKLELDSLLCTVAITI